MIDSPALTAALQKQVVSLEDDLRKRVEGDTDLKGRWIVEHQQAISRGRTASAWVAWSDDRITQAAVGWVLTSVFIRYCEDNALVAQVWIAGPEHRRQEALDGQLAFFRAHPLDTDREWLAQAVAHLAGLPATAELVGKHAAIHLVQPSGDAVSKLLAFWRERTDTGRLVRDFTDSALDSRFLGDLYQDLSAYAKATFALLQTPVFVEEFILDRTLEPALADRPLAGFKMIDPTCGSGHFLLGAFDRLLDRGQKAEPGLEQQALVQQALDAVHGVDLNPVAVAIARFRLTIAALKACSLQSLEQAPAFRFHLAVGDSLLHGAEQLGLDLGIGYDLDVALSAFVYVTEDLALLQGILEPGRYDCVVGNPPYITVKDQTLNQAYRDRYPTCKGAYALSVPFMERFFGLAKRGDGDQAAGWVGQITSNSFMKREFGSKLVEEFLAFKDLRLIADSEGAWIPGHNTEGTPTVILIGRNQRRMSSTVRAVLSKGRRETSADGSEGKGPYWSSLVEHVDEPGWDDGWITIADLDRSTLASHPWSLSGGSASDVMAAMGQAKFRSLGQAVADIGFGAVTREDDAYMLGTGSLRRAGVSQCFRRPLVEGKQVREWHVGEVDESLWPYAEVGLAAALDQAGLRILWAFRALLRNRVAYGETQEGRGLAWFEYSMFFRRRYGGLSIAVPSVATHVHAALDREVRVFKDTTVLVKLEADATEAEHFSLLGVLNSSAASFWLKERCKPKGGAAGHLWARTYQFNGGNVSEYPLPAVLPEHRGQALDALALELSSHSPEVVAARDVPTGASLATARDRSQGLRARMIAVQEELDWECYRLYGLVEEDLTYPELDLPGLALGERAFEVLLARAMEAGEEESAWFTRHGSTPITELPGEWPAAYRDLANRRIDLIANDPGLRLLEQPEYKRRWAAEPWEKRQERALRGWLLDRLEDRNFWFSAQGRPTPRTVASLADEVDRDPDLRAVLRLWDGRPDVVISEALGRLLAEEGVPFLAAYRYKEPGLRKREAWDQTWALQRQEDAGVSVGVIPVPPKYTSADFQKTWVWQHRGKLDVPKERFISYPNAGRETDPTQLLGWAGWDHAQQSLALSVVIGEREVEGWEDSRLVPLVAGLCELQPWVDQWHAELDPTYGVSLAAFCREQLSARMTQVGKTLEELSAWRPEAATRGRRPRGI